MKIYLGADHRGFSLKGEIGKWLFEWGYDYLDVGAQNIDPDDDYTKYAASVASLVAENKGSRGILICGSGVGADITANKFDGVRASIGIDAEQVRGGRSDDDMNILIIAAEHTSGHTTREMIKTFLDTKFTGKVRYKKRLEDIRKIEENN